MDMRSRPASNQKQSKSSLAWHWVYAALLLFIGATWLAWWQDPLPIPANRGENKAGFFKPIEVNPHRRLDWVGGDFLSITFLQDGQRGWAVGSGGVIVSTSDSGASWKLQSSGTKAELGAVHVNSDGQRGWALGSSGVIVHTVDGGGSWKPQISDTLEWLKSVHVHTDGQLGWAVGSNGAIVHTKNGGASWKAQSSGTKAVLNAVYFHADGTRGWAVGASGTIVHTIDGGSSWKPQISGTNTELNSVLFYADGQNGFINSDDSVLRTKDAGATWNSQSSANDVKLSAVHFQADGQRGWRAGIWGSILATADGGLSWKLLKSGTKAWLRSVYFHVDSMRGWVVGSRGIILHTADGGVSWKPQSSDAQAKFNSVHFHAKGQRGWTIGDSGLIAHTADRGATWKPQNSNTEAELNAVHFLTDGQRGWVVGSAGVILNTADGGVNWKMQSSGTKAVLGAVHFHDDGQRGWAVGDGGLILSTIDGGTSWKPQDSRTQVELRSVHFHANSERGWVVGDHGLILRTTDGGVNWKLQNSGIKNWLSSVHFHAAGQHGWVVGSGGIILQTVDGGDSWKPQISNTRAWLSSVRFLTDGQTGWAAGHEVAIVSTTDGGATWKPQSGTPEMWLNSVHFQADGKYGWTVGDRGAIFRTTDGGATWKPAETYLRYPGAWYWLAVLICGWLLWLAWHFRRALNAADSVADVAASDAAVSSPSQDRLEFGGLARGISRFLRNQETQPPLTMAITGDWGSGKSSLMQLLCADLKRFGHRPIWFNAWHHQKEEHLFAALLGAIRSQACPSLFTPSGLIFRLRLLWLRSKRHYMFSLLVLLLLPLAWSLGPKLITGVVAAATQAIAGLLAFWAAIRGMKAFGIDPAVLLTTTRGFLSLKVASDQNNLRTQFASEFKDLTRALPYRLVLVVDDLDRCKPSAVLDVMEAVNYLTSAGDCFVIFGMAPERVKAALGLAFKDIAAEMADLELHAGETSTQAPDASTQKRRAYANDYLQKLVNIEIKVPVKNKEMAHQLLDTPKLKDVGGFKLAMDQLAYAAPLVLAAAAIVLGAMLAEPVEKVVKERWPITEEKSIVNTPLVTITTTASITSILTTTLPPKLDANLRDLQSSRGGFERGASVSAWDVALWSALALLPLLLLMVWIVWSVLRSAATQTKDSDQFRVALQIWAKLVAEKNNTPRFIKRFGNRVRYLAMLQQGETKDETVWDGVQQQVSEWWRGVRPWNRALDPNDAFPFPEPGGAIAEHQLIALGAVHELFGQQWRNAVAEGSGFFGSAKSPMFIDRFYVMRDHETTFSTQWPPSPQELDVFERLLSGVRLSGDPQQVPVRGQGSGEGMSSPESAPSESPLNSLAGDMKNEKERLMEALRSANEKPRVRKSSSSSE